MVGEGLRDFLGKFEPSDKIGFVERGFERFLGDGNLPKNFG